MHAIDFTRLARESIELTERIVRTRGPRLTGTEACRAAAEDLAGEAGSFTQAVRKEPFDVHPGAFYSYTKLLPAAYLLGFLALFAFHNYFIVAAALLVAGILLMFSQFAWYLHIGDAFFPARTGVNVEAVIEPAREARRELILSGHHDSAPVARIFSSRFRRYYAAAIFLPYLFFLLELGVLLSMVLGARVAPPAWALPVLIAGLPVAAGYFSMVALRRGSPGAGDNLVSSALVLRLGREIAGRTDELLRSTRLRIVSFDGEEAGLRGAAAYMRAHARELSRLPCFHLNFDSIYRLDCLKALTSDINGTLALSRSMVDDLRTCAAANGISLGRFSMVFGAGATDAAESARRGIESTTIIGMPTNIIRSDLVYHTPFDTPEHIEPAAVEACLRLAASYLGALESEGVFSS